MQNRSRGSGARRAVTFGVPLALALLGAAALWAGEEDRPATPDEVARVRKALEAQGYTDLSELEVDCRLEVDAKNKAGQPVSLEVDLETMKILDEDSN